MVPIEVADVQTQYLRNILGFIGIDEVEFVYAEGLGMGAASQVAGLASAHEELTQLGA